MPFFHTNDKSGKGTIRYLNVTVKQFSWLWSSFHFIICCGSLSCSSWATVTSGTQGTGNQYVGNGDITLRFIRATFPSLCRSLLRKPREERWQVNTCLCNHFLVIAGAVAMCTWHKPVKPFLNEVNVHQNGKWIGMNQSTSQCIYPLAWIWVH